MNGLLSLVSSAQPQGRGSWSGEHRGIKEHQFLASKGMSWRREGH